MGAALVADIIVPKVRGAKHCIIRAVSAELCVLAVQVAVAHCGYQHADVLNITYAPCKLYLWYLTPFDSAS